MKSLFQNQGFLIRIWSPLASEELAEEMKKFGIPIQHSDNNKLQLQVLHNKVLDDSHPNAKMIEPLSKSRALLTLREGINEMDHLSTILRFIKFGKSQSRMDALMRDTHTNFKPYETTELTVLENLEMFIF